MLSYPKFTYVNHKSFQNFNKTSSKIDQAHCPNQTRIMIDPNSQSFQHLLHKPAKVDHNLISFQPLFTLNEKILSTKFFDDSLTFNSNDVCSRFFNAKFNQRLQQRHKLSIYQFKKQADESIVKKNTLTLFEL